MKPTDFWKNFRLGEELHIAGVFIYNGLRRFHELEKLSFADELFEFLYELSIGLERLLKIAVVLYEHNDTTDQQKLEKSIITHSHIELMARLRKQTTIDISSPHNDLLNMLSTFYKSTRYNRFSLNSVFCKEKEPDIIVNIVKKYLQIEFADKDSLFGIDNNDQCRRFVRRTVMKITREVYRVIIFRASQLGLYTYELRNGSKAETVFLREVDIADEDILWKELLIFFINTKADTGYLRFLRETPPLAFDPALTPDYLDCFKSNALKTGVMDELECLYEEMNSDERKERLLLMRTIGANLFFDDEEVTSELL